MERLDKYIFAFVVFLMSLVLLNEIYKHESDLSSFSTLGSMLAAVAAAVAAWFSLKVSSNAYKLSVFTNQPHLDLHLIALRSEENILLKLINSGGGPGKISKFSIKLNNNHYDFFNSDEIDNLKHYFKDFGCDSPYIGDFDGIEIISGNGELKILAVPWPPDKGDANRLKEALSNTIIATLGFDNVHGEIVEQKFNL